MLKVTNQNYAALIHRVTQIDAAENLDKLGIAPICGYSVLVPKSYVGELGVFFPPGSKLNKDFCSQNNLFRDSKLNSDTQIKGYLEESGRVKAIKLKGNYSEGIFLPVSSLDYLKESVKEGDEFNELGGVEVCTKYVTGFNRAQTKSTEPSEKRKRHLVENEVLKNFSFHIDTPQLGRNLYKFKAETPVVITRKYHGTSAVFAHIPAPRKLSFVEKILVKLGFNLVTHNFIHVWSSRKVVKGILGVNLNPGLGYYSEDIWTKVHDEVREKIEPGITLYGEIIGWVSKEKQIQKDYTYGLPPGKHAFIVYRITYTEPEGKVWEFGYDSIVAYCVKHNLEYAEQGPSVSIFDFADNRMDSWLNCYFKKFHLPKGVPEEGVVIRKVKSSRFDVYKYKTKDFLQYESGLSEKEEVLE